MTKLHAPVLVSHSAFEQTGYPRSHPLGIARVGPVVALSRILGWLEEGQYIQSEPAELATLLGFHDADYMEALLRVSASGLATADDRTRFALGTAENPVFAGMAERIGLSVGGSILAASKAMEGRIAYHPAGGTHHGRPERASGFCYSNDPAFAIFQLLNLGAARVAYIDLDAHHGDGVEDTFKDEGRVCCVSVHEAGRWPGTGLKHNGNALNFAVAKGFNDLDLCRLLADEILPMLVKFKPEAVVLTCGADCLKGDPLSTMALSNNALWRAVGQIVDLAPAAVVLGGGGYNPWTTVRYWTGLWGVLNDKAMPETLPKQAQGLLRGLTCDLVDDDDFNPNWLTTLADQNGVQRETA